MKSNLLALGTLAILASLGATPRAKASSIITFPITYTGHVQYDNVITNFTGSAINESDSNGYASASAFLGTFMSAPTVSASGETLNSSLAVVSVLRMEFAFQVCPLSGCAAPSGTPALANVTINAHGTTSGTGAAQSLSDSFLIAAASNGAGTILNQGSASSWTVNTTLSLDINTLYYVTMSTGGAADTLGSFSTMVDPMFSVDQTQYSLQFSTGIVNGGETPLPGALPLFASGLGALGLLGWRKKRKAQAAA